MRHGSRTRHGKPGTKREYLPTPLKKLNIIAEENRYSIASRAGTRVLSNGEIVEVEGGVVVGYKPFNLPPLVTDRNTQLRHWDGMSTHQLGTIPKVVISRAEEFLLRQIRPWKMVRSDSYWDYLRLLRAKSHGHRRLFTDEQLIELYEQGLRDREIAEELDVSRYTVRDRRRKLGLKAHARRRLFTDQQLIALHEKGMIDREIAEELGVSRIGVYKRRRMLGFKAYGRKLLFTDQQLIDFHKKGLNDREIAEELGVPKRVVIRYHRRKLGLKAHGRRRLFTDEQLIELYEQGLRDREIGERLGAHESTVNIHRRRLGLKPIQKHRPRCVKKKIMELSVPDLVGVPRLSTPTPTNSLYRNNFIYIPP